MSEIKERPILFSTEMVKAILREDSPKTQTRRVMSPQPLAVTKNAGCVIVSDAGERMSEWWTFDRKTMLEIEARRLARYRVHYGFDYEEELKKYRRWVKKWTGLGDKYERGEIEENFCPYGKPGDRLWVRETWATIKEYDELSPSKITLYDRPPMLAYAEWTGAAREAQWRGRWRPSIHMPRWASRLTLEITEVRVERVQEISESDALAEGIDNTWKHASWLDDSGIWQPHTPITWFAGLWDSINLKRGYGWDSNPWVRCITFKRVTNA